MSRKRFGEPFAADRTTGDHDRLAVDLDAEPTVAGPDWSWSVGAATTRRGELPWRRPAAVVVVRPPLADVVLEYDDRALGEPRRADFTRPGEDAAPR